MAEWNRAISLDRRTLLAGLATVSSVGVVGANRPRKAEEYDSAAAAIEGAFAPEVPPTPEAPYLVSTHGTPPLLETLGWEATDRETLTETLLELAPELLSVQDLTGFSGPPLNSGHAGGRHSTIARFAYRWGFPHSSGFTRILEADNVHEEWYQQRPAGDRWSKPDGTRVEHPRELAAETFEGKNHLWTDDTSKIIPSVFARGTIEYESTIGSQIYQLGANQLFLDGFEIGRLEGNDFSVWARSAFEEHLRSLSSDRREELGIDDPGEFDIRTYLEDEGFAPDQTDANPANDPIYREYTRYHHQRQRRYAEQVSQRSKGGAPDPVRDAGASFFGNLAGIAGPTAGPIYLTEAVDEIDVEVDPTLPPDRPHDVTVKTGLAAGRYEKPVRIEGKMHRIRAVDTLHGLDPNAQYPTLMRFQTAQAYAHGGVRGLSLTSWADVHEGDTVNHWIRPDGTIADELQRLTDFIRANERFLHDATPTNRAALIVSLPTLIWQRAPQWDRYEPPHSEAVRGGAAVLRREHIPYDVVIFDYPPVWDARKQLERLPEYDLLVLLGVEAISDAHIDALEAALDDGTEVIATGGGPSRTEEYQPRGDVAQLLEDAATGTVLDSNPERARAGAGRDALRDSLPDSGRQVELGTDADVSVNLLSPDEGVVVCHLLNYEYDPDTDAAPTRSELRVSIRGMPFEPAGATYRSMAGTSELELSVEGDAATVTVPELDVWGFVVFKESDASGQPAVDRSTAEEAISSARSAIDTAEKEDRTIRLVQAREALANAEPAMEYGGLEVADRAARAGVEAAEAAYRVPVIGIDQAHNQTTEYYESDLTTLQETFRSYEYRTVESWTEESLGSIDLLIVPPIVPENGDGQGFEPDEIDASESFVSGGGSLLVLGTHRPKPGLNRLAGRFGFSFDGRPINKAEGDIWAFDVESSLSAVTPYLARWGGRFGTVLDSVGTGTVLGRVDSNIHTWLTSQRPFDEQSSDEPAAAGKPVLAGRAFGEGHVVVSGEARQFVAPTNADGDPAPLPGQLLRILGRRARYARRTGRATPAQSPTTRASSPTMTAKRETSATEQTTPEGPSQTSPSSTEPQPMPGFGIGTAIGGLTAFSALLTRLLDDSDSE